MVPEPSIQAAYAFDPAALTKAWGKEIRRSIRRRQQESARWTTSARCAVASTFNCSLNPAFLRPGTRCRLRTASISRRGAPRRAGERWADLSSIAPDGGSDYMVIDPPRLCLSNQAAPFPLVRPARDNPPMTAAIVGEGCWFVNEPPQPRLEPGLSLSYNVAAGVAMLRSPETRRPDSLVGMAQEAAGAGER